MAIDNPIRILYMEDNQGLAILVQRRLQRDNYIVDLAYDGAEGLAKASENIYDIIIIDHDLPIHMGLEIITILNERETAPPMVLVTGYGDPEMAVQALKIGAFDYVVKDGNNGYLEYLPTIIEQVLDQQRLINEKRDAERNRELLIEELDAFAHTVAHDLKSPLGIIINAVMLLEEQPIEWDDESTLFLDHIRLTSKKMFNIIEELLLLASVRQQKKSDIYFQQVDMRAVIRDSLFRLEQLVSESQAEIVIPDSLPAAYGYAPWLEEVWVNYISNALKYGGTPPHIEITAQTNGAVVEYSVIDNGTGIPDKDKDRLFTPFTRLHHSPATGDGHGLGLSIVQRIIEQLDGRVGMEKIEGNGSRFWFCLPKEAPIILADK